MFAGGYPQFGSTYASGWWYAKHGTSSPGDDSYSHAWIAVANQQGAWNVKYTDFVSSVSGLGAGDFLYYEWTETEVAQATLHLVQSRFLGVTRAHAP